MKNSAWWLRTQIYFFKIHSKSDHFLPHSPIFYLYCCNKFLTDLFIFYSCPPTVYFSRNGQHGLSKMHIISHYFLTAIPLLASPLLVIKSKLLTTACQAPCELVPAYLSPTLSFTTFTLFTMFQPHWLCCSLNTGNFFLP